MRLDQFNKWKYAYDTHMFPLGKFDFVNKEKGTVCILGLFNKVNELPQLYPNETIFPSISTSYHFYSTNDRYGPYSHNMARLMKTAEFDCLYFHPVVMLLNYL